MLDFKFTNPPSIPSFSGTKLPLPTAVFLFVQATGEGSEWAKHNIIMNLCPRKIYAGEGIDLAGLGRLIQSYWRQQNSR